MKKLQRVLLFAVILSCSMFLMGTSYAPKITKNSNEQIIKSELKKLLSNDDNQDLILLAEKKPLILLRLIVE